MSLHQIIRENIKKLINENMNANDILSNIFSKMDVQIDIETTNLRKKQNYYEEIKRLAQIYNDEISQLGVEFSRINTKISDDCVEINYHIQGSEQWSDDDAYNFEERLSRFDNYQFPHYYLSEVVNYRTNTLNGYKIVLELPVTLNDE